MPPPTNRGYGGTKIRGLISAFIYLTQPSRNRLAVMGEKRFLVFLLDGTQERILAVSGDEDQEEDGYVFFLDAKGEIVGLFSKDIVESWREDLDGGAFASSK